MRAVLWCSFLLIAWGALAAEPRPPHAALAGLHPELERKLIEIQVFTELQLGLVFSRLDCQYQKCDPRSLFLHEVFSDKADYRLVEKLPPECAGDPGAQGRLGGQPVELACNHQKRTYVNRSSFEKLSRIDQALLVLLRRLDVFAPYEPFSTKLQLIQGLRLLHERLTARQPDEAFRERFFSPAEISRLEKIPTAHASLCRIEARPWEILPSGAILIGKNRIEGRNIRLGAGTILHNTSIRGDNILILASRLSGFVEGKNIEIRRSSLFDSVQGENLVLTDTVVAAENRLAILPEYDWRMRRLRIRASDARLERTVLTDSRILGKDLQISDATFQSVHLHGNDLRISRSRFRSKTPLPTAEERNIYIDEPSYPYLVWMARTGDERTERLLRQTPGVEQLYSDLETIWWGQAISGEISALDRNSLFKPYPDPNRTEYQETEFSSRAKAPLEIRGDGLRFHDATVEEYAGGSK